MRLLNVGTLKLEYFADHRAVPEYAIFSHTWADEEVSFRDLVEDRARDLKGWPKLRDCCVFVQRQGWQYVWVDTCCIDKNSSAELSEAINSMFEWYSKADICYAYLEDVHHAGTDRATLERSFIESRWFTRGWTLQELLAPHFLMFLDKEWNPIGPRSELTEEIEHVTSISPSNLTNYRSCSIATIFSWAAHRQTTRVEDQAYCLLGLFGINMPLIYGEGQNAFIRLQLEIIRYSDDESIFCWSGKSFKRGYITPGC